VSVRYWEKWSFAGDAGLILGTSAFLPETGHRNDIFEAGLDGQHPTDSCLLHNALKRLLSSRIQPTIRREDIDFLVGDSD